MNPYDAHAQRMAGVAPTAAVPYPLYGIPQMGAVPPQLLAGAVEVVKNPVVTFFAGAAVVGALWIYFDVVRPRMKKEGPT